MSADNMTTDGRTLSQVCTELVEAKQTAARMNDALRDLAVELGLPIGVPPNVIVEAIQVKVSKLRQRIAELEARPTVVVASHINTINLD